MIEFIRKLAVCLFLAIIPSLFSSFFVDVMVKDFFPDLYSFFGGWVFVLFYILWARLAYVFFVDEVIYGESYNGDDLSGFSSFDLVNMFVCILPALALFISIALLLLNNLFDWNISEGYIAFLSCVLAVACSIYMYWSDKRENSGSIFIYSGGDNLDQRKAGLQKELDDLREINELEAKIQAQKDVQAMNKKVNDAINNVRKR